MSQWPLSRRQFIAAAGRTLGLAGMPAAILRAAESDQNRRPLLLWHTADNGADFGLHFVNVSRRGSHLIRSDPSQGSFMIVQLPPQSLHEQFFYSPKSLAPTKQLDATLAGPSFLTFRVWPFESATEASRIPIDIDALLDWTLVQRFSLQTALELDPTLWPGAKPAGSTPWRQFPQLATVGNPEPVANPTYDLSYYTFLCDRLLVPPKGGHRYITLFELPAGIVMVPIDPTRADTCRVQDTIWRVVQNHSRPSQRRSSIYSRTYGLTVDGRPTTRRIVERWGAEISGHAVSRTPGAAPREFSPALRAIGLVQRNPLTHPGSMVMTGCDTPTAPPVKDDSSDYLPNLLDSKEIVFLNQLGVDPYRAPAFDIQVEGPLRVTTLGASVKLRYRNYNTKDLDPAISLVEYEHHFEEGRDNYIKIARIGVNCRSGLKVLHVKIAHRRIVDNVSFVEYKEYIDPFQVSGVFRGESQWRTKALRYEERPYVQTFADDTWPLSMPFSQIDAPPSRSPAIEPTFGRVNVVGPDGLDDQAFWAYQEAPSPGIDMRDSRNLITLPHAVWDRADRSLGTIQLPVLFLRRDFFCNRSRVEAWLTTPRPNPITATTPQCLRMWDDERFRVAAQNRTVALTLDDPDDSSPRRLNQLQTEWIENHFAAAAPADDTARKSPFDWAEPVVYPQMRQAKVYVDHIQHFSKEGLPSVVEFQAKYLEHEFDPALNAGKFILTHTDQFLADQVKTIANQTINDPDIKGGWDRIEKVFRDAGEALGALVNPDPPLRHLALSAIGVAAPKISSLDAIEGDIKSAAIDPGRLFGGANAELFCGIKLSDILRALDLKRIPQYVLDKVPAKFADPSAVLALASSNPIVQDALQAAMNVQAAADSLKQQVVAAQQAVQKAEGQLQAKVKTLDEAIPTRRKIEAAIAARFEAARSDLAGQVDEQVRRIVTVELAKTLQELAVPLGDITDFLSAANINKVIDDVLDVYGRIDQTASQYLAIQKEFEALRKNLTVLQDRYKELAALLVKPTAATLQALELLVELPTVAPDPPPASATALTETLFKLFELAKGVPAVDQAPWQAALPAVEAVRRLSGDYVRRRVARLAREADDACQTVPPEVFESIQTLADVTRKAEALRKTILTEWQNNRLKAVEDLVADPTLHNVRDAILAQVSPAALKAVSAVQVAQQAFDQEQQALLALQDQLAQRLAELGKDLLTRFGTEFSQAIQQVRDSVVVQQAMATYDRVTQALNAVQRQQLAVAWSTADFRSVDLGLLRFEPGSSPTTTLALSASATIGFDVAKFPSAAISHEAHSESSLTNFSVTFFNVIRVNFDSVRFVSGTGTPTKADVRIGTVEFTGAMSFIQKLEELVGGLVDGLRVALGPTEVLVGYQSPALDLSSPGFTFSNFSIGLALTISFQRQPVRLRFQLADVNKKATVAAGIYGGAFFCALDMDVRRGIVRTDMALELGVYIGISFGPFSGFVRIMVGLRYTREDAGVSLDGYFVAEGSLSVWVFCVSARLYMGVRSHNSVAEGYCIASYTLKVGFIEKTFESGYSKRLAGATQNGDAGGNSLAAAHASFGGNPSPAVTKEELSYAHREDLAERGSSVLTEREFTRFQHKYFAVSPRT